MEDCTLARRAMEAFIDGELDIAEEADLQTHLAGCASCTREFSDRKTASSSLGSAVRATLGDARSTPAEKRALVERMVRATRPPLILAPRIAAAAAMVAILGIVAYAAGLFRKPSGRSATNSTLATEAADAVARRDAARARYEKLLAEIERMTEEVRSQLPPNGEATEADHTAALELSSLEDQVCNVAYPPEGVAAPADLKAQVEENLRNLGSDRAQVRSAARKKLRALRLDSLPHLESALESVRKQDRWFVSKLVDELRDASEERRDRVVIRQSQGDRQIEFRQYGDAQIEVVVTQKGTQRKVTARGMNELLRKHEDLCKQFAISGCDGSVVVGDVASGMELDGQLELLFRARDSADFSPVRREAYAKLWEARNANGKELESRLAAMEKKCRQAEERLRQTVWTSAPDLDRGMAAVRGCDEARLRALRSESEQEISETETKIREFLRLGARIDGLKTYVQEVKAARK